ncbi:BatA domain-containing protein [Hymenobacter siberiensis]|uniref:BatA domain-containing protein n=1 Tax=Hymenobacter siberiensis TaxID=2848396 RepID=UPI001C1DD738|nr:BatA domain-containing protein [Hymenobacter siberiensis]
MFALLHPAALLALTGLLVPVAIHLWNRRPAREVAVGSLRWLAAGANRRLRNLKLEQLWLLLLRAALLAVLAVAVAGPVWRTARPISRGVVLLSAEAARLPTLAGIKLTIDSLRRKGYALRWLSAGFPRVPGAAWRAVAAGRASAAVDSAAARQPSGPAWARVQQAAATFAGQPVFVVTSAALRDFGGRHAPLPAAVSWQALPDTTTSAWLAAAGLVGDSLHLLVGHSNEARTTYRPQRSLLPPTGQIVRLAGLAPLRLQPDTTGSGSLRLVPANGATSASTPAIEVRKSPLTIDLYATPEYTADARYWEAAVRAAAVGLPVALQLRRVTDRPRQLQADWTCWLSDEALPRNWQQTVQQGATIWQEAAGPGVPDTASFAAADASGSAGLVFRRGARPPALGSATVWADGRGRPVLSRRMLGRGATYQLHTRLAPPWSELADDPQMPARLLKLLQPAAPDEAAAVLYHPRNPGLEQQLSRFDHRALDPAQLTSAPRMQPTAAPIRAAGERTTDLRPWLVLAAGLLFLLERWLAGRRAGSTLPTSI